MNYEIICLPKEEYGKRDYCSGPFWVRERAKLRFSGGVWSWRAAEVACPWRKHYPIELETEKEEAQETVFLCQKGETPVGEVTLCRWWNHFICVKSLAVAEPYRRKGIAGRLMEKSICWAKEQDVRGMFLQTQDINIPAMRLYEKWGFKICGIDTMFYYNSPHRGETAIFYYLLFAEKTIL